MNKFLELADRCEKATEPDRDLDCEIAVAVHGGEIVWKQANYTMESYPARKYASKNSFGGFGFAPVERFTASQDDAMTIAKPSIEQAGWYGDKLYLVGNGNRWSCAAQRAKNIGHWSERWKESWALACHSAALAICACSLRVLGGEEEDRKRGI